MQRWSRGGLCPIPIILTMASSRRFAASKNNYYLMVGNPGAGDMINSTGMIRSMDQVLVDLITEDEACLLYMDRKNDIQLEVLRRALEAAGGSIDLLWLGEDLGTQRAPMISKDLFRKHIRPRHQKFVRPGKALRDPRHDALLRFQQLAYEDFIEMGNHGYRHIAA